MDALPRTWWFALVVVVATWMVFMSVARTAWAIRKYGLRVYVQGAMRMEPETWRLVGVLVLLALLVILVSFGQFPLLPD